MADSSLNAVAAPPPANQAGPREGGSASHGAGTPAPGAHGAVAAEPAEARIDPAVRLAASLARLESGARLSGTVEGHDSEGRALLVTDRGVFAVDPGSAVPAQGRATIVITHVARTIDALVLAGSDGEASGASTATSIDGTPAAHRMVRLTLVAVPVAASVTPPLASDLASAVPNVMRTLEQLGIRLPSSDSMAPQSLETLWPDLPHPPATMRLGQPVGTTTSLPLPPVAVSRLTGTATVPGAAVPEGPDMIQPLAGQAPAAAPSDTASVTIASPWRTLEAHSALLVRPDGSRQAIKVAVLAVEQGGQGMPAPHSPLGELHSSGRLLVVEAGDDAPAGALRVMAGPMASSARREAGQSSGGQSNGGLSSGGQSIGGEAGAQGPARVSIPGLPTLPRGAMATLLVLEGEVLPSLEPMPERLAAALRAGADTAPLVIAPDTIQATPNDPRGSPPHQTLRFILAALGLRLMRGAETAADGPAPESTAPLPDPAAARLPVDRMGEPRTAQVVLHLPDAVLPLTLTLLPAETRQEGEAGDEAADDAAAGARSFGVAVDFPVIGRLEMAGRVTPLRLMAVVRTRAALGDDLAARMAEVFYTALEGGGMTGCLTFVTDADRITA